MGHAWCPRPQQWPIAADLEGGGGAARHGLATSRCERRAAIPSQREPPNPWRCSACSNDPSSGADFVDRRLGSASAGERGSGVGGEGLG